MSALPPFLPRGQWDPAPFLFCPQQAPVQEDCTPSSNTATGQLTQRRLYLDPNVMHTDESQMPGVLLTALIFQKAALLRFLIDSRIAPQITKANNPEAYDAMRKSLLEIWKLDRMHKGVELDADRMQARMEAYARLFMMPRSLPGLLTVFRNGAFHPLCQTPDSPPTKPIALFNIADDWSSPNAPSISKLFGKSFLALYAKIAEHFTVVRVLVNHPVDLIAMAEKVKALLPGVPLLLWSLNGHSGENGIKLGKHFPMTVSDARNAFEHAVDLFLSTTGSQDAHGTRTKLLSDIASGEKRIHGLPMRLSTGHTLVMRDISGHVALQGSIVLQGCSCARGKINLAQVFSTVAFAHTVYGSPDTCDNIIPKIFYIQGHGLPQFIPFFLWNRASEISQMQVRAYSNGELRADVSGVFTRAHAIRAYNNVDLSAYMAISMEEHESRDPNWQRLIEALEDPSSSPFAGSVCILAPSQKSDSKPQEES